MPLKAFKKVQDTRREITRLRPRPDEHNRMYEMKNMIGNTL